MINKYGVALFIFFERKRLVRILSCSGGASGVHSDRWVGSVTQSPEELRQPAVRPSDIDEENKMMRSNKDRGEKIMCCSGCSLLETHSKIVPQKMHFSVKETGGKK